MKKLLIALPVVAGAGAAAIAGTSQYAGSQTQDEYYQLLTQLNGLSPLVLVNEQYDAGLASSSAITKVLSSATADANVLFRLQHDIRHAPVRMDEQGVSVGNVRIDTLILQDSSVSEEFMALFSDSTPLVLTTDVSYGGRIHNQLSVNAFAMTEDAKTVRWSGMSLDGFTQNGATKATGSFGELSFDDAASGGKASVGASNLGVDVQHHGDNVYTGNADATFDNVSVFTPDMSRPVSVERIDFVNSSSIQDTDWSNNTRFSLNDVDADVPVNNASLNVQISDLPVEGLRLYNKVMTSLSAKPDGSAEESEMALKMAAALKEVAAPNAALKYSIEMSNSEGAVNADLRIALKDASAPGMNADALDNISTGRDLLNVMKIDGSLNADTAALAQTPIPMMLAGAGDFISVTDESITSSISLDGTTLGVNGVELPLEMMIGGFLDVPLFDLTRM